MLLCLLNTPSFINLLSSDHRTLSGNWELLSFLNLFHITELISSASDNRVQVDVIYTDLSNAFDRLDLLIFVNLIQFWFFLRAYRKDQVQCRLQWIQITLIHSYIRYFSEISLWSITVFLVY